MTFLYLSSGNLKSEAVEQAVDNAGGFDLDERRPARRNRSRTGAHGSSRP